MFAKLAKLAELRAFDPGARHAGADKARPFRRQSAVGAPCHSQAAEWAPGPGVPVAFDAG